MKYERMTMPDSTASLIWMALEQLELQPFKLDSETVVFGVQYEDGSEPIFMVRSVVQATWFRRHPGVVIVAAAANEDMSLGKVFLQTFMRAPKHASDKQFVAELAMHIKSTAWAIAGTEDMGECVDFPGRPAI